VLENFRICSGNEFWIDSLGFSTPYISEMNFL